MCCGVWCNCVWYGVGLNMCVLWWVVCMCELYIYVCYVCAIYVSVIVCGIYVCGIYIYVHCIYNARGSRDECASHP